MSTLKGTEVTPEDARSLVRRKEVNQDAKKVQIEAAEKQFSVWEKFMQTDQGQACSQLAEPQILEIDRKLALSALEFCNAERLPTLEFANEKRAELRGERRVWLRIKTDPDYLRSVLNKLEEK